MNEFLAMGGYAWYVWMAYGACALAVAIEIAAVRARRKRAFDELRKSEMRGLKRLLTAEQYEPLKGTMWLLRRNAESLGEGGRTVARAGI